MKAVVLAALSVISVVQALRGPGEYPDEVVFPVPRKIPTAVRRMTDGRCGYHHNDQSCGDTGCCSVWGYCGWGENNCNAQTGACQVGYGICLDYQ